MNAELLTGLRDIRNSFLKTAEVCQAMPSNDKNKEFKTTRIETVKKMIEMDSQIQQIQQTFEHLCDRVKKRDALYDHKEIKELWAEETKKFESVKGANEDELKRIIDEIENGEDEMEVMNVHYSKKDPISKKDIKKPVKADKCNHVYDLDSITEFAGQKRVINCAMQGCKAKVTIAKMRDFPEFFNLCGE